MVEDLEEREGGGDDRNTVLIYEIFLDEKHSCPLYPQVKFCIF